LKQEQWLLIFEKACVLPKAELLQESGLAQNNVD
jgi:hypothetical protein